MTIDDAWQHGRFHLQPTSPTPELDARLLLQHLLKKPHSYFISHNNEKLTAQQQADYEALLKRASQKEPIPYIIGHAPFFDLDFVVTPDVLIPRPETEQLVQTAVSHVQQYGAQQIVDVGAGSGCIPIMLARLLPHATIHATDISPAALAVAQQNAAQHVPNRIQFYEGNLLEPLPVRPDLIVANLPYITDGEWTELDDGVKWYEPALALRGGQDGLDLIRQLLHQATAQLAPDGAIFLEIGWQQGEATRRLAKQYFPNAKINVEKDFAEQDRFVLINQL